MKFDLHVDMISLNCFISLQLYFEKCYIGLNLGDFHNTTKEQLHSIID